LEGLMTPRDVQAGVGGGWRAVERTEAKVGGGDVDELQEEGYQERPVVGGEVGRVVVVVFVFVFVFVFVVFVFVAVAVVAVVGGEEEEEEEELSGRRWRWRLRWLRRRAEEEEGGDNKRESIGFDAFYFLAYSRSLSKRQEGRI